MQPTSPSQPTSSPSWATWVSENLDASAEKVSDFVSKHFAMIAFIASSIVMLCCAPISLGAGLALGAIIQQQIELRYKISLPETKTGGVMQATIAIVGAVASVVRLTPAGAAGGIVFQAIPLVCSMVIGASINQRYASNHPHVE